MSFIPELWVKFIDSIVELLPKIAGAIIVLIIGWISGRAFGKLALKITEKTGVSKVLRKTIVGRALESSGVTMSKFFDILIRWFIYLIAILAAVDILKIEALSKIIGLIVQYLPSFLAGIVILLAGLVIADFIGDAIAAIGREAKIEFAGFLSIITRSVLYFVVIIIALTVMKIDVSLLYMFANALAWGIAIGVGAALGIALGLGLKDYVSKNAEKWLKGFAETTKKTEDFWSWYTRREKEESQ
ncbi:MAG: hypothetical protein QW476_03995 [Candidatus Bathyarchaeia archaeon]|nr:hypothetical protein [Candidatus Bathyarchaeota archaeon]